MSVRKSIRKIQSDENTQNHCKHCTFKDICDTLLLQKYRKEGIVQND